jgi:hypothetical protein
LSEVDPAVGGIDMRITIFTMAVVAPLACAIPSAAQDVMAEPTFATINLDAGFRPDPQRIEVVSGGALAADELGSGCAGFIAEVPDVRINYTSGDFPLIFSVTSHADTTLVINAPNGSWYCDDDAGGLNPMYQFGSPESGAYDVFIGSYEDENADATLAISEVGE